MMTRKEIKRIQKELSGKRATLRSKREALLNTSSSIKSEKRKLENSLRSSATASLKKKVVANNAKLQRSSKKVRAEISDLELQIGDLTATLIDGVSIAESISHLDDSYPIFLMPVRVETRFMTIKHIARIGQDKIKLLDEDSRPLTVDGGQLVSERPVVSVDTVFDRQAKLPAIPDHNELWVRIFPDDIAIHTHEQALTEEEVKATQTFWTHIWYAGSNKELQLGAWRGLVSGRGPERAAWIAKTMKPKNESDKPSREIDEEEDLPIQPIFPDASIKEGAYSQAPHSKVLPERWVVRLVSRGVARDYPGNMIPDTLQLGLDPLAAEGEITSKDGLLEMSEKIAWVKDFDEAERVGMAIRIPLDNLDALRGFDKLLVLGVKSSANEEEGKKILEELLENHHYTHGGLSLVPQGTPTNNTEEGKSGYTAFNNDEEHWYDLEFGDPQFSGITDDKKKKDGQHLADALGISHEALHHVQHAGNTDVLEAMCMNTALWPTTLGYYLSQMMHPAFSATDISNTRGHFNQYVLGRGRVPVIRIDDQPYGILPTTAFSKLTYDRRSATSRFLKKLHEDILKKMEVTWDMLSQSVKQTTSDINVANFNEHFLEVVGLHASSVEFYQRHVTGPYFLWNIFNYNKAIKGQFKKFESVSYAQSLDFIGMFADNGYESVIASAPRLLDFLYSVDHKYLDGQVVDKLKLSEERGLSKIGTAEQNYIDWLQISNWNQIKNEDFSNIGVANANPPNSLLYLMLRHSALLEYVHTGINILANNNVLSATTHLDLELVNIPLARGIITERTRLVKASIAQEEQSKLEKELDKKVEIELKRTPSDRQASLESLMNTRKEIKNRMRADATPALEEVINTRAEAAMANLIAPTHKIDILEDRYSFSGNLDLSQYIQSGLGGSTLIKEVDELAELKDALSCLSTVSTARLERAFAEHIDLTSYRLDAWHTSLASQRLDKLRGTGSKRKEGIYLGGYAWLENIRPSGQNGIYYNEIEVSDNKIKIPGFEKVEIENATIENELTNISLVGTSLSTNKRASTTKKRAQTIKSKKVSDAPLALKISGTISEIEIRKPAYLDTIKAIDKGPEYAYLGNTNTDGITYDFIKDRFVHQPVEDNDNQGYIHAPSINHATASAVLRAGYIAHGSDNSQLAVNLNSKRVRNALHFIEGLKNGQELGALLGYQLERGLHDYDLGIDQHILEFRNQYPLVANRVINTTGATNVADAESYNVTNGVELLENSTAPNTDYPYDVVGLPSSGDIKNAIIAEVQKLHDIMDSINDLLMSESMYQVAQGNFARANGALNAMSGKSVVIDPQVIKTPRNFHVLAHRFGVQFDLSPGGATMWTVAGTPRSIAEPKLNRWISTMIPSDENIKFRYSYTANNTDQEAPPTFEGVLPITILGLEPIDLYYMLSQASDQGYASEFINLIGYYIKKDLAESDDIDLSIQFTSRDGLLKDDYSLYELRPIFDQLKKVIGDGRPLRAEDFLLSGDADQLKDDNPNLGLDTTNLAGRLSDVTSKDMSNGQRGLAGLIDDLNAEVTDLSILLSDENNFPLAGGELDDVRDLLIRTSSFGVQNVIPATSINGSLTTTQELLATADRVKTELTEKLEAYSAIHTQLAGVTDENGKLSILVQESQHIFTRSFKIFPEFKLYNPNEYKTALLYPDYLKDSHPQAIEEWVQGLSPVRKRVRAYHQLDMLSGALTSKSHLDLTLAQIPLAPLDKNADVAARWLGVEYPDDYQLPDENISFVFSHPDSYSATNIQAGIMIDDWVEELPDPIAHTGIAVHYNNPDGEPPQTCLLAVSPELTGKWSWEDLMDTLDETLDWAKKRAVDPDLLGKTFYNQVLPATYAAVSASDNTPTLDYGRNVTPKPTPGKFDLIRVTDYVLNADIEGLTYFGFDDD